MDTSTGGIRELTEIEFDNLPRHEKQKLIPMTEAEVNLLKTQRSFRRSYYNAHKKQFELGGVSWSQFNDKYK